MLPRLEIELTSLFHSFLILGLISYLIFYKENKEIRFFFFQIIWDFWDLWASSYHTLLRWWFLSYTIPTHSCWVEKYQEISWASHLNDKFIRLSPWCPAPFWWSESLTRFFSQWPFGTKNTKKLWHIKFNGTFTIFPDVIFLVWKPVPLTT